MCHPVAAQSLVTCHPRGGASYKVTVRRYDISSLLPIRVRRCRAGRLVSPQEQRDDATPDACRVGAVHHPQGIGEHATGSATLPPVRRTITTRASLLVTALAAGTVLLGGCTGEPDDTPTAATFLPATSESAPAPDTGEASATPSAEPSTAALAAPELPAAATEQTPEGAAAFATWWFDTLNYATATGDTAALTAATQAATCAACIDFVEDIDDVYSGEGRYVGSSISAAVELPQVVDDRVATFPVRLEVSDGALISASGDSRPLPAEQLVLVAATVWVGSSWQMGDLRQ